jgi:hypothetical protein
VRLVAAFLTSGWTPEGFSCPQHSTVVGVSATNTTLFREPSNGSVGPEHHALLSFFDDPSFLASNGICLLCLIWYVLCGDVKAEVVLSCD